VVPGDRGHVFGPLLFGSFDDCVDFLMSMHGEFSFRRGGRCGLRSLTSTPRPARASIRNC
jgi:hypothetical protein